MASGLVFVHGWGQAPQTWHAQQAYFAARHDVTLLRLPGHGGAPDVPATAWPEMLAEQLPDKPYVLVGWSLGGMLAQQLALRGERRLRGLVLLASTPSFRMRPDWPYGCAQEVLHDFHSSLGEDAARLLGRFFALMLQGDDIERREYLAIVRHAVDRQNPATQAGLESGLHLLETMDLRDRLEDIRLPTLVVHGDGDAIVSQEAGQFLARRISGATLRLLPAGHAPHLTRPNEFNQILEEWCLNSISTRTG